MELLCRYQHGFIMDRIEYWKVKVYWRNYLTRIKPESLFYSEALSQQNEYNSEKKVYSANIGFRLLLLCALYLNKYWNA